MKEQFLRKLYADIIQGYTRARYNNSYIYFKHIDPFVQGLIDEKYLYLYDRAIAASFIPESEKLKELEKSGEWTKTDDDWISNQEYFLENLYKSRAKPAYISHGEILDKQIKEAETALNEKLFKKKQLLFNTADVWAESKIAEYYIYYSLFADEGLKIPLFAEEDFRKMDEDDLAELVELYNKNINIINENCIKHVALSAYTQGIFHNCFENFYDFLGKPLASITFYQGKLIFYAAYFKKILSSKNLPFGIKNDPDKLIDWYSGGENTAQDTAPVADVNKLTNNLSEEAVKNGGKLNSTQLASMFGQILV